MLNNLALCTLYTEQHVLLYTGGMVVLYLCAQLALMYTYNCLLILIYYKLGQSQLIINKYAVRSRYSSWPIKLINV